MQEFFFTIVSIWLIWRLFSAFSSSGKSGPTYQQTTHHHYYRSKQEDSSVRVETKKPPVSRIPSDEGEYVDFEEVK